MRDRGATPHPRLLGSGDRGEGRSRCIPVGLPDSRHSSGCLAQHPDTWHRPDTVRSLSHLVVYERPGSVGGRPPSGWPFELVDLPLIDVSSTDIRDRVRRGEPIDGLVPPAVVDIVRSRSLYTEVAA